MRQSLQTLFCVRFVRNTFEVPQACSAIKPSLILTPFTVPLPHPLQVPLHQRHADCLILSVGLAPVVLLPLLLVPTKSIGTTRLTTLRTNQMPFLLISFPHLTVLIPFNPAIMMMMTLLLPLLTLTLTLKKTPLRMMMRPNPTLILTLMAPPRLLTTTTTTMTLMTLRRIALKYLFLLPF